MEIGQQIDKLDFNYLFGDHLDMLFTCPSCQKEFGIIDEEPEIRRRLTCPNCLKYFAVTWLYPFTLELIEESQPNLNLALENEVNKN